MPVFFTPIPQNLRTGLVHASNVVFFNNRTRDSADLGEHGAEYEVRSEVSSHLPLQMLLYFSMFFFPFWWISEVIMLDLKFTLLPGYYQYLMVGGMVILTTLEVIRVYLGYFGNLKEKVPELAGFWLVSSFFQLPIMLFFVSDEGLVILPLERVVHSVYLCFLLGEMFTSFVALKIMTRKLEQRFHLREFKCGDTMVSVTGISYMNRSVVPIIAARGIKPH
ncbi:transmembrane protein 17A [Trichomycterus rosablanca]|uniref:transmembrane protein 17A n=1 Tax=Trichomycterus rosablanca TaxID=2290929 RepID=UPI002F357409